MNVPCTAHGQLVSDEAATREEEQSVSLGGRNKVKRLREQRKTRDMAREVFCMFPLQFVGKRRWAAIKARRRRKEMKPRISIAVYALYRDGNRVSILNQLGGEKSDQ